MSYQVKFRCETWKEKRSPRVHHWFAWNNRRHNCCTMQSNITHNWHATLARQVIRKERSATFLHSLRRNVSLPRYRYITWLVVDMLLDVKKLTVWIESSNRVLPRASWAVLQWQNCLSHWHVQAVFNWGCETILQTGGSSSLLKDYWKTTWQATQGGAKMIAP